MSRRNSNLVSLGILFSRIFGLVRQRVLNTYLGQNAFSDVFYAAFRIPNFLQNLFGEGALSASFIPSYSKLLGEGKEIEARKLAGAVLSLLALAVAAIVLLGELTTPWIIALIVGKWSIEQRELSITLVRILFPGAGLLVLSAWCLGVLNSHRRFLLSYATPVVWNIAIIVAILVSRHRDVSEIVIYAAWGSVLGSLLQIAVQWPTVRSVAGAVYPSAWGGVPEVRAVMRAFIPNVLSRGANQISAFIDLTIAGRLAGGALSAITNAQTLYTLPVSLFGMAVSASELPEMSREQGDPESVAGALRVRLSSATQRLAYYIVPSAMGFLCLGGVIATALFQHGKFKAADSVYVWMVLAGSAIGLLASTLGRLYASAFYALRDTRTPLNCGLVRVVLTGALGLLAAFVVPDLLGWTDERLRAVGLAASAGMAGWIEFVLLRRGLCKRIGRFDLPTVELFKLWGAALVAAAVSTGLRLTLGAMPGVLLAVITVSANALTFLMVTSWLDIPEAAVITERVRRLIKPPRPAG